MESIKSKWSELSARNKNVFIGVAIASLILFMMVSGSISMDETAKNKPAANGAIPARRSLLATSDNLDMDAAQIRLTLAAYEDDIATLKGRLANQTIDIEKTNEDKEAIDQRLVQLTNNLTKMQAQNDELLKLIKTVDQKAVSAQATGEQALQIRQSPTPTVTNAGDVATAEEQIEERQIGSENVDTNLFALKPGAGTTPRSEPSQNADTRVGPEIVTFNVNSSETVDEEAEEESRPKAEFYIPPGSIISGTLITGLDAQTNAGARQDNTPALIMIEDPAIMANYWKLDISKCMGLVQGYGNLSDERAHLQGVVLTCVTTKGDVIEAPMPGYVVDTDSSTGLRGKVITKQGVVTQKIFIAGVMESLSTMLGNAFQPTEVTSVADLGSLAAGAGASGMGNAFSKLADLYVDLAGQIFPVVEIKARRKLQFITTAGIDLNANNSATISAKNTTQSNTTQMATR
jgi:conjugal transfer pilus assembly protein TraB